MPEHVAGESERGDASRSIDGPVATLGEWAVSDAKPIIGINGLAGMAVKPADPPGVMNHGRTFG